VLFFNNLEILLEDAKFSSENVFENSLENVAFAFNVMNQLHIPKLLGVIWSSE